MDWSSFIGAIGIGSLVTAIATNYMAGRRAVSDRWYQEKRDAYLGLLRALHNAAVSPSDENAKAYALWQTHCDLFGSPDVSQQAQALVDTNEGPRTERQKAFRALIDAMKIDLRR